MHYSIRSYGKSAALGICTAGLLLASTAASAQTPGAVAIQAAEGTTTDARFARFVPSNTPTATRLD